MWGLRGALGLGPLLSGEQRWPEPFHWTELRTSGRRHPRIWDRHCVVLFLTKRKLFSVF